jgi:cephalosporin hydroxylase
MTDTFARYQQHYTTQSDIQHHLGLLFSLARGSVLELGTRTGVSTAALLAGVERNGGMVVSVDIDDCSAVAAGHPQWAFWHGSSTDPNMAQDIATYNGPFQLILVDTFHSFEQATAELALWGPHVAPGGTICMHDPETFPGVRRAAQEFADRMGWPITFVLPCHGMAVIERPE